MKQDDMDETIHVLICGGGIGYRDRPMTARLRNGKPQCQGGAYRKVGRFGEWVQCVRDGTYLEHATERMRGAETEKFYYFCASHAPSKVAERDAKRNSRWKQKEDADKRKRNRDQAARDIIEALRAGAMDKVMEAFALHEQNLDSS